MQIMTKQLTYFIMTLLEEKLFFQLANQLSINSIESGLYTAYKIAKQVQYLHILLKSLGITLSIPTTIYKDNTAIIAIFNNKRITKFLRHISIRQTVIFAQAKKDIILESINTTDNSIYNITKVLRTQLYCRYSRSLLVKYPLYHTILL